MTKRRVMLTIPAGLHSEPVIYNIGQQFNLVTTIYQADLAEDRGWVTLELDGEDKDIEEGIAWAMSKGIRVDTISDR
jgi:hypothetical protein